MNATLLGRTVRGAAWTIFSSVGSRGIGLVGTLLLTYYLAPEVQGEVAAASIVALTATQFTELGVLQYIVAHPRAKHDVVFPIFVVLMLLAVLGLSAVLLLRVPIGRWLDSPGMGVYLPGFALVTLLQRALAVPERLLIRDLKFRMVGLSRVLGEVSYSVASVSFAVFGFGGMAIVYANVARTLVVAPFMLFGVAPREWLTPAPIKASVLRPVFHYGVPLSVGALATFATRRWDSLAISALFGPATMGLYDKAYNFADIPATQVGEQIGDVLLPTFAHMDPAQRKDALVRATGFLALIVFPLAIGLGVVAPTLVYHWLAPQWAGVAPMLTVLSALSVTRPIGWTVSSYLQAGHRPRAAMGLGLGKLVFLLTCIVTIGRLGPLWACGAVGVAYALHSIASLWVVGRFDGARLRDFFDRCAPALLACIPMTLAVLATRWMLGPSHTRHPLLPLVEIFAGSVGYLAGAFTLARGVSRELIGMVRDGLRRRRGGSLVPSP